MSLTDRLLHELRGLPEPAGYLVAFSGGGDSTALIHALAELRQRLDLPVRAMHVDHGLHPDSGRWSAHCDAVCRGLGVELLVQQVSVRPDEGGGLEAAARRVRHDAFRELAGEGDMLLMAHTRDDQAETMLLRLLRGTGLEGLGGIPRLRTFGRGWLARPLLDESRASLRDWLRERGVEWLEDPDNLNLERSRAYLRGEILPRLSAHWPAASAVIARAADNLSEAGEALTAYAAEDVAAVLSPDGRALQLAALRDMAPGRRRAVLRQWLRGLGLPEPGRAHLSQLENQALEARDDAVPAVAWPGAEVHRFRAALHAFAPRQSPAPEAELHWRTREPLALPAGLGELRLESAGDVLPDWGFTVRFRRGGERIRLPGREHHTDLKNLFQEWAVPPWERGRIPLLFEDGELVAVADLQPSHELRGRLEDGGLVLRWRAG